MTFCQHQCSSYILAIKGHGSIFILKHDFLDCNASSDIFPLHLNFCSEMGQALSLSKIRTVGEGGINPSNAEATFVQSIMMPYFMKTI